MKYILFTFEIGRWDIKTKQGVIIKLPAQNYSQSIKNFLSNYEKFDFKNFKTFDYRVKKRTYNKMICLKI